MPHYTLIDPPSERCLDSSAFTFMNDRFMMTEIYGIKNCDTMKKAFRWLEEQQVNFVFYDYKKQPPSDAFLQSCLEKLDWESLINKRGTTWRKLDESIKTRLSQDTIIEVLQSNPSMIKRPLLIHNQEITLGFDAAVYLALFR